MMDSFISRVYLQMCDPLFSSCKEIQNLSLIFEYPSVKEILRVLCKEKETERSRLFALGFAGSKEGIEVFFNLHLFFTNGFRYGELNVLFNCVYLIP